MATVGNEFLTLADWSKRVDPNGEIDEIVEVMAETNEALDDMLWRQGNLPTGHKTTVRRGLPTATWRMLNYGVPKSKSVTAQVTDAAGMLETYSEIDKDLAMLNGNTSAFRASEDDSFLQAMSHQMAQTLFYGNTAVNPERFMGFAPRYSDGRAANAENARNILNGGGAGATNTSIWLVMWGPQASFGFFPPGSMAGLQFEDLGQETLTDANGGMYEGYRTHYQWKAGLCVRDWRYAVRIANIDVSQLSEDPTTGSGAHLFNMLGRSLERIESLRGGRVAFYCNRTIKEYLRLQRIHVKNVRINVENESPGASSDSGAAGREVMRVDGIPVRRTDALLNTEAAVPF